MLSVSKLGYFKFLPTRKCFRYDKAQLLAFQKSFFSRFSRRVGKFPLHSRTACLESVQCTDGKTGKRRVHKANPSNIPFDKRSFEERIRLVALKTPGASCHGIVKLLKGYLLQRPGINRVIHDPHDPSQRLVLLSEAMAEKGLAGLPLAVQQKLESLPITDVVFHDLVLGYDHWPADHILKKILPEGVTVPSSFETIGHIAHLNLRDEALPFKHAIADVILDKNQPRIRTVVNKVGTIESTFRVPQFEVLAGESSFVAEVRQHGAIFQLDYSQVYWNSRLEFEHQRLVSSFERGQIICDMFAGVGPFAIPAAQIGCHVFANDLNPESARYLGINAVRNKVDGLVHVSNLDARDFFRRLVSAEPPQQTCSEADTASMAPPSLPNHLRPQGASAATHMPDVLPPNCRELPAGSPGEARVEWGDASETAAAKGAEPGQVASRGSLGMGTGPCTNQGLTRLDHVVMNLPASAIEFFDVFEGAFSREHWQGPLPRVHCYCFSKEPEEDADLVKRAEKSLRGNIREYEIWEVRDVAPNKRMLCLSFHLPETVAFKNDDREGRR